MFKFSKFFKDKNGRIVLGQSPNSPLIGWFVCMILTLLWGQPETRLHHILSLLSFGFIFTWAWLEITDGVNYFRRLLGTCVLIGTFWFYLAS